MGSWSKISKFLKVCDFSFCGSKSSLLKHTYQVSFWKSNCWGSWSKISKLHQVDDFLGLKFRFWNTRTWCNFGNHKQHFYGFVKKMVQKNQFDGIRSDGDPKCLSIFFRYMYRLSMYLQGINIIEGYFGYQKWTFRTKKRKVTYLR